MGQASKLVGVPGKYTLQVTRLLMADGYEVSMRPNGTESNTEYVIR